MLIGRLGLEASRIPHSDRHGLLSFDRGSLFVKDGSLRFACAGGGTMPAGEYHIPHQTVSMLLLGPGSSVSHDALRIMGAHGVGLAAVGEDGVRLYTAPPLVPDTSDLARRHATLWATERTKIAVARRMYAIRLGEVLPHRELNVLRGIEGSRVKVTYQMLASKHGIKWSGRRYDRANPDAADLANQAINHASSAVEAAAAIASATVGAIPQLGFIHEASGASFVLDVADLYREKVTVDCAFSAVAKFDPKRDVLERVVRKSVGLRLRRDKVIADMIDTVKKLLTEDA